MRVVVKGQAERSLIWATLDYTRFNLGVIALGAFFLVGAEQGADVVRGLAAAKPLQQTLFHFAVFAWGWQSWFWARFMLQDRLDELEDALEHENGPAANGQANGQAVRRTAAAIRFVRWYPRALGLTAMLASTVALVADYGLWSSHVAVNLATIALFVTLVIARRWIRRRFSGSMLVSGAHVSASWVAWLAEPLFRRFPNWQGQTDMPVLAPYTILLGLVIASVTSFWAFLDPVDYGFKVGSASVVFFGLASILPVGSIAVWWLRDKRIRPVMTGLLAAVVVSSFFNHNHYVRTVDAPSLPVVPKPGAWESLNALLARHGECRSPIPVVMVATAGGGARAAYWTATVLAGTEDMLQRQGIAERPFADHLFAISGVSGGSVGAAYYVAALRALGSEPSKLEALQFALSKDYLGPSLAGLLYQDLWQSFVPWPTFEDRGSILERAFEAGFAEKITVGDGLQAPLGAFNAFQASDGTWLPRLLLNGTNATTGQRMVASTVALHDTRADGSVSAVVADALDQHRYLSSDEDPRTLDMRLSTAAHNSARFPVISPGGMWPRGRSVVADGGYFENFGAQTLLDLVTYIQIRSRSDGPRCPIKPVIVQISSDPEIGEALSDRPPPEIRDSGPISRLWSVVGVPVGGILGARKARGLQAANDLRRWGETTVPDKPRIVEPVWVHFKMPHPSEIDSGPRSQAIQPPDAAASEDLRLPDQPAVDPPLGWVLSWDSRRAIDRMLTHSAHNRKATETLLDAFRPAGVTPIAASSPAAATN